MASPQISALEQLMMELINRARLDPDGMAASFGIDLNQALQEGTISSEAHAPLAWNLDLAEAAANHAGWLLATGTWDAKGEGGSTFRDRAAAAGYSPENRIHYFQDLIMGGDSPTDPSREIVLFHFGMQFRDVSWFDYRTRQEIFGNYNEFGAGQETGPWSHPDWGTGHVSLYAQYFGKSPSTFLTGVAYADRDGDHSYDLGEGLAGVTFDWTGDRKPASASMTAGGYNVLMPSAYTGLAEIQVKHGGSTMKVEVAMAKENAKLDYMGHGSFAASADLHLGAGARNGLLLGVADLDLIGNAAGNRLEGGTGANRISGEGGNDLLQGQGAADTLDGGKGDDTLWGGTGRDVFLFVDPEKGHIGRDAVMDFARGDKLRIDLAVDTASEAKWENSHIDATADGFRIALGDSGTITVHTSLSVTAFENALTLT